jgi:uncharacterized protein YbjT (DUF2867 family)
MAAKRTIAVVGATGAQGGGLIRAILSDAGSSFAVRALTRDVNSPKARELAGLGAEVVEANLDDVDSVKRAFHGAYGAFCVTFFWAHFSPERELAQAAAMAYAARSTGIQHVIWSTLEDTRKWVPLNDNRMPTLMGKYKVPHFDAKGEANHVFSDLGLPVTFLLTSFYWDNFIHFGMGPQPMADGTLAITMPMGDKKLPGIAAEDIGKCAHGIFKRGREYINRTTGIASEHLTGARMAACLARHLGRPVHYNAITPDEYRGLGFPGAQDLGNMFQFNRDFESAFCGARSVELSRELNISIESFDAWVARNKALIPIGQSAATA